MRSSSAVEERRVGLADTEVVRGEHALEAAREVVGGQLLDPDRVVRGGHAFDAPARSSSSSAHPGDPPRARASGRVEGVRVAGDRRTPPTRPSRRSSSSSPRSNAGQRSRVAPARTAPRAAARWPPTARRGTGRPARCPSRRAATTRTVHVVSPSVQPKLVAMRSSSARRRAHRRPSPASPSAAGTPTPAATRTPNRAQIVPSSSTTCVIPSSPCRRDERAHLVVGVLRRDADERHVRVSGQRLRDRGGLTCARRSPRGPEPDDDVAGDGRAVEGRRRRAGGP